TPEDNFLGDAMRGVATVEPVGDRRELAVLGEIRIQQIQRSIAEGRALPDLAGYGLALHLNANADLGVLEEREAVGLEFWGDFALCRDLLLAVTLLPENADADDWIAAVMCGFQEVAGENAQAAGIALEAR